MNDLEITPEELSQLVGSMADTPVAPAQTNFRTEAPPPPPIEKNTEVTARPVQFAPLQPVSSPVSSTNIDLLLGVTLRVTVELGRTKMNIEEILKLGPGSVVELDKLAGEPVDVLINDRLIARGEVVVLDDRFGVRITEVIPPAQRLNSLK